jgi:hypothetical protein
MYDMLYSAQESSVDERHHKTYPDTPSLSVKDMYDML